MAYKTEEMVRAEIRATIEAGPLRANFGITHPDLEGYLHCSKCNAPFEWLLVGGKGDHRNTITCERCLTIQKNLPFERVILPLSALSRGNSLEEERAAIDSAEQDYQRALAEAAGF